MDRTRDGKAVCMLAVLDGHSCESLAIHVKRKPNSQDVPHVPGKLFLQHGPPRHIRPDDGPEFVAGSVRERLARMDAITLFTEPGTPGTNGCCESFDGKLRDDLLTGETFASLVAGLLPARAKDRLVRPRRGQPAR